MKKTIVLSVLIFAASFIYAQSPQSFNYQAVVRDGAGVVIPNQLVSFRISIQQSTAFTDVYVETQQETTNDFGLVNLQIGTGSVVSGVFADIDWASDLTFIQIEMDEAGGINYQMMGLSQLLSVPYALYAEKSGVSDSSIWKINGNDIYYNQGNVGIGLNAPTSRLVVRSDSTANIDDVIFSVLNAQGDTVMAVYQEGVRIWVADDTSSAKATGNRGGFAVGGFNPSKGLTNDYLFVTPDSVRVYVEENSGAKASGSRGGFAVGGFNPSKALPRDLFYVIEDSSRFYVEGDGGFRIENIESSNFGQYLNIDPDNCFIGFDAGMNNTTGLYNILLGNQSGYQNLDGSYNVFLGNNTGGDNIDGDDNIMIGNFTGQNNTSGSNNIFMGTLTGNMNQTGLRNIFIGSGSGSSSLSNDNIYIGNETGVSNTTGANNVCVGNRSLFNNNGGSFNTMLGMDAGYYNLSGSYNVFLGFNAGSNELGSEKLYIENSAATSSNALIYGEFDNDLLTFNANVGIGTITPDNRLDVNGKISLTEIFNEEMVILNGFNWVHGSNTQIFGNGGDYFLMASKEGSVESAGIYGDGNNLTLWSAGDGVSGQPTALLYLLDEDYFDGSDTNPYNNSALMAYVTSTGIWQVSDGNKKQNINKISNALDKISLLSGYSFEMKINNIEREKGQVPEKSTGILANELEQVLPDAVQSNSNGEKYVNYSAIIPLLIEGIKEQQAKIKQLEDEIEILKQIEK